MPQAERRVKAHTRQLQALELRKAGLTYARIAEICGYASKIGAHKAVQAAIRSTLREVAEDVRSLEIDRLDALLTGVYPQAIKGNQGAIDRVLRIMERRAKLLGLDAPAESRIQSVEEIRVVFADGDPTGADAAASADSE